MSKMKFKFTGDISGLAEGIGVFAEELGFETAEDGMPVEVEKTPSGAGNISGKIKVAFDGKKGAIKYCNKIHFFRALGLFIEAMERDGQFQQHGHFQITEEPQFTLNGPMFDASRNAVLTVESIKTMIRKMALMGLNMLMLYTEDTYIIESRPYFGYMRGRYSYEELKECDDYADIFGIEIIPCIQTLAHLTQALKWRYAEQIRDTGDILLAGDEKTYQFIEDMMKAASAPFRSKRIHIGMDEAHNLGLGKYLDKNGYQRRFDIMNKHLERVVGIASRFGLKPMIWSDMYFMLGSKSGNYYDPESVIPQDVIDNVPMDVRLVYWDYFHADEEFYREYIRRHKKFGSTPVFAGGIWTWIGFCTNYSKTFKTSNAALNACKAEGVREVIATIWGDNGNESNCFSALLGLQLYAEHGYARQLDMDKLKKRFKFCTGGEYESFMDLSCLDEIPGSIEATEAVTVYHPNNPSKYLLWQDTLIGLFDKNVEGLDIDIADHYSCLKDKMKKHIAENKEWGFVFDVPEKLCSVLSIKSDIGLRMKDCYDKKDLDGLKQIVHQLSELLKRIIELRNAHREQWFRTYKPFGWEVLDLRYGGLSARIDTAIKRITDYLEGRIDKIDELEEERLYFDGREGAESTALCHCNLYHRIVTAGDMIFKSE